MYADEIVIDPDVEQDDGLRINKRTGKYVGGGASLGSMIGAITGESLELPSESLLTFPIAVRN